MKFVQFLGYKNGGKTTALEYVCRKLVQNGWKVGTVKSIHEPNFTIDRKGKDTWRHAQAGASVIVLVARNELTVIKKGGDNSEIGFEFLRSIFKRERMDFVLVEGLYEILSPQKERNTAQILCAKSRKDALQLLQIHPTPICISGKVANSGANDLLGTPLVKFPRDTSKVARLLARP